MSTTEQLSSLRWHATRRSPTCINRHISVVKQNRFEIKRAISVVPALLTFFGSPKLPIFSCPSANLSRNGCDNVRAVATTEWHAIICLTFAYMRQWRRTNNTSTESPLRRCLPTHSLNALHCRPNDTYSVRSRLFRRNIKRRSHTGNRIPVDCFRRYSETCKFARFIRLQYADAARSHATFYINFPIQLASIRGRRSDARVRCTEPNGVTPDWRNEVGYRSPSRPKRAHFGNVAWSDYYRRSSGPLFAFPVNVVCVLEMCQTVRRLGNYFRTENGRYRFEHVWDNYLI